MKQITTGVNNKIKHSGIIDSISVECIRVRIVQASGCAACKVAGHCNASDSKEKLIDIYHYHGALPSVGQEVVVTASSDVASRALLYAFLLPLVLMLGISCAVMTLTGEEVKAALGAVVSLVPYYGVLYLFRRRLHEQLAFEIEEIIN